MSVQMVRWWVSAPTHKRTLKWFSGVYASVLAFDSPFGASTYTPYRAHWQPLVVLNTCGQVLTTGLTFVKNSISVVLVYSPGTGMILSVYLNYLRSLVVARIHLSSTINIFHCCYRTIQLMFHGEITDPPSSSSLSQRSLTRGGLDDVEYDEGHEHGVRMPGTP